MSSKRYPEEFKLEAIKQILSVMTRRLTCLSALLLWFPHYSAAEEVPYTDEDLEVSYMYPAVLGTGTYLIKGNRLTMLKVPFSWHDNTDDSKRTRWRGLLPVVVGYNELQSVDSDIIDVLFPNNLVTFTFLPGIEYLYQARPGWQLKPFMQAGASRDFSTDETIYMAHAGIRSLNLYTPGKKLELRWGNAMRWAAEYQVNSGDRLRMSVFETGLDLRYELPVKVLKRRSDTGIYYIYQYLLPKWINANRLDEPDAKLLHEVGVSFGLKRPYQVLGMDLDRVRLGYKTGGSFEGWTLGTGFPF